MGTDMARAWWAWNRPEQTARALLDAYRASPGEVRDRLAIRSIVTELAGRHSCAMLTGTADQRPNHRAATDDLCVVSPCGRQCVRDDLWDE
ncbi:hypothetical protein ACFY1J_38610 [Streptomyces sp. NPDC001406]|uniref:hypothetical protein n=1 Tax=Streptomyces sp. NPDC001406 TaxID=3364572 RepID=UPI00368969CE